MSAVSATLDRSELDRRTAKLLANERSLVTQAATWIESYIRRRFLDTKTAPDGTPWEPWSDDYAARRAAQPGSAAVGLLRLSDNLLHSNRAVAQGDSVVVSNNLVYAAAQHEGRPEINLPARPWIGLSADDRDDLRVEARAWLRRGV